jgi:myosin X
MADELKLKSPELFSYTALSGVTKIEGKSDEVDFEEVQNSFKILRFTEEDRREIYRLVAGVLHFGNVKFRVEKNSTGDDGSSIVDAEVRYDALG